jgi:protein disulfide-isomerase A6
MKPAWDKLGGEYASSSSVLVGDVDCTVHQDVCTKYGVKGYPTIKYFTPESAEDGDAYSGGRDFDSLKKFVDETLEVKCKLDDTSGCTDKESEFMTKWKAKPAEDAKSQLERLTKMQKDAMAKDLKKWVDQRVNILKQLVTAAA